VLQEHFAAACADIDSDGEEIGTPKEIVWFPDRSFAGRTFVPAADEGDGPDSFEARADFTGDVAEENPDWQLDLNEMVLSAWRGEAGHLAEMTLVWGIPLVAGGSMVTAELADHAVDQCELLDQRFTLIAPDNYLGDYLEVKLWDRVGDELAVESLYAEEEETSADDPEDD
jgi:hypothetical protein